MSLKGFLYPFGLYLPSHKFSERRNAHGHKEVDMDSHRHFSNHDLAIGAVTQAVASKEMEACGYFKRQSLCPLAM
jgi:hypothetical protein